MYKSFVMPDSIPYLTLSSSVLFREEFKTQAIISDPKIPFRISTWFFINAINGDIMIAIPSKYNADI